MATESAICLIVDRLRPTMLGPYGNTWVRTPTWNQLAADSFLCDQVLSDTPDLAELYASYWYGTHRVERLTANANGLPLAEVARRLGRTPQLLTDDRLVERHPGAAGFESVTLVEYTAEPTAAADIAETRLAQFFAAASDAVAAIRQPATLLWLHCGSLGSCWDAPYAFRSQYADEDDPPTPELVLPPNYRLGDEPDPDEILGMNQAYAGQITLLDTCLGALWEAVRENPGLSEALWIVASHRGFPLGEHGRMGPCDDPLYQETLQGTLLLRSADRECASGRTSELTQPCDLYATILDAWGERVGAADAARRSLLPLVRGNLLNLDRDRALAIGDSDELGIRTPHWYLRRSGPAAARKLEIFAKPDDRWEVNDVADRMADVVQQLDEAADAALAAGRVAGLAPLAPEAAAARD